MKYCLCGGPRVWPRVVFFAWGPLGVRAGADPARFTRDFGALEGLVKPMEQPWRRELCLNGLWQFQTGAPARRFPMGAGDAPGASGAGSRLGTDAYPDPVALERQHLRLPSRASGQKTTTSPYIATRPKAASISMYASHKDRCFWRPVTPVDTTYCLTGPKRSQRRDLQPFGHGVASAPPKAQDSAVNMPSQPPRPSLAHRAIIVALWLSWIGPRLAAEDPRDSQGPCQLAIRSVSVNGQVLPCPAGGVPRLAPFPQDIHFSFGAEANSPLRISRGPAPFSFHPRPGAGGTGPDSGGVDS
jgi:hypothetical protein